MNNITISETENVEYSINTSPDTSFDNIVKLATLLLDVPVAVIKIVEANTISIKSSYGLDAKAISDCRSLCDAVHLSQTLIEIKDMQTDSRTFLNPLVMGGCGLKFYAAVPLVVKDGYSIGQLCVADRRPRELTNKQKEILQSLAGIVLDGIKLRVAARTAIDNKNIAMKTAAHDLRNPLSSINILADMIQIEKDNAQAVGLISSQIKSASAKMKTRITQLSEVASGEVNAV